MCDFTLFSSSFSDNETRRADLDIDRRLCVITPDIPRVSVKAYNDDNNNYRDHFNATTVIIINHCRLSAAPIT